MYQELALNTITLMTVVTSVMGAICVLRGSQIYELRISTRNFMYVGSCCAMCIGFLGATTCLLLLETTGWHYLAATALCVIGLFATAHLFVDLNDRLRFLKRT